MPISAKILINYFANKELNFQNWRWSEDSGITLTRNNLKDIIKLIKYLENRGILLKGNYEEIINQNKMMDFLAH